jgi:hypothetical protein
MLIVFQILVNYTSGVSVFTQRLSILSSLKGDFVFFSRTRKRVVYHFTKKEESTQEGQSPPKRTPPKLMMTQPPQTGENQKQMAHFNSRWPTNYQDQEYYPPANDLSSSSWSAFALAEHHKMHSPATACTGAVTLGLALLKTQSFRCFQNREDTKNDKWIEPAWKLASGRLLQLQV